jgi:hypothetical protein
MSPAKSRAVEVCEFLHEIDFDHAESSLGVCGAVEALVDP